MRCSLTLKIKQMEQEIFLLKTMITFIEKEISELKAKDNLTFQQKRKIRAELSGLGEDLVIVKNILNIVTKNSSKETERSIEDILIDRCEFCGTGTKDGNEAYSFSGNHRLFNFDYNKKSNIVSIYANGVILMATGLNKKLNDFINAIQ